jgi:mevalonate pyrophosphate decarboxylase
MGKLASYVGYRDIKKRIERSQSISLCIRGPLAASRKVVVCYNGCSRKAIAQGAEEDKRNDRVSR